MGMTLPHPMMVEGARMMLEHMWKIGEGKLPDSIDEIYALLAAHKGHEQAAICIALQEYFPDHADNYRFPPTLDLTEVP